MQDTQAIQDEELAKVRPTDFVSDIAILTPESYKMKYMCAS
jgi:hypothetical protein